MTARKNVSGVIGVVVLAMGMVCLGTVLSALAFRIGNPSEFADSLRFLATGAAIGMFLVAGGSLLMGRARLKQARSWLDLDSGMPLWTDLSVPTEPPVTMDDVIVHRNGALRRELATPADDATPTTGVGVELAGSMAGRRR